MKLEVITPEKKLFNGEVDAVQFPGVDGSFQVLNGHAPIISALKEGKIKAQLANDDIDFDDITGVFERDTSNDKVIHMQIKGGVVEMQNDKIIVLAE
ncbi:MAG: F0F1 ATP synthase subunit epsilon [Brumimicrobium sp.]|nr:F0F1 ATP synthase subunit epsilon [Brumimicrobium sp.]MCO5268002.1 F0F1 ATP synthase subunit epsilon [Brumimicrobium sp.]